MVEGRLPRETSPTNAQELDQFEPTTRRLAVKSSNNCTIEMRTVLDRRWGCGLGMVGDVVAELVTPCLSSSGQHVSDWSFSPLLSDGIKLSGVSVLESSVRGQFVKLPTHSLTHPTKNNTPTQYINPPTHSPIKPAFHLFDAHPHTHWTTHSSTQNQLTRSTPTALQFNTPASRPWHFGIAVLHRILVKPDIKYPATVRPSSPRTNTKR